MPRLERLRLRAQSAHRLQVPLSALQQVEEQAPASLRAGQRALSLARRRPELPQPVPLSRWQPVRSLEQRQVVLQAPERHSLGRAVLSWARPVVDLLPQALLKAPQRALSLGLLALALKRLAQPNPVSPVLFPERRSVLQ
jgi:hypothetical protein